MSAETLSGGLPRRGNRYSRWVGRTLLKLWGWKVEGQLPELPKLLVVVAPHTSNLDFLVGILVTTSLGLRARWVAKHTLFESPLGGLLRWLDGIPIDRRAAHGTVRQLVSAYQRQPSLLLAMTPEGTRKKVPSWKSGFYHIATQAKVPLVPATIDYCRKVATIMPVFELSGSYEDDLKRLQDLFADVTPRYPENF